MTIALMIAYCVGLAAAPRSSPPTVERIDKLRPLHIETPLVEGGNPAAIVAAPAGEYRISVRREGEAYVFAASTARAVTAAPEGFCLGGGMLVAGSRIAWGSGHDDRWYFQVPQDAAEFKIAGTSVERLVIRDPDGKAVEAEAAGSARRVAVSPAASGKLWSIEAAAAADVVFSGIRPVFAYRDAKTFFMPADTALIKMDKLVPPATYAPEQRPGARGTGAGIPQEVRPARRPREAATQPTQSPGAGEAPRRGRRSQPAGLALRAVQHPHAARARPDD